MLPDRFARYRRPARRILGILFIAAGVMHFIVPSFYVAIMPPYLPSHRTLVYLSGVAEVLGGVGVLLPSTRRLAGWGLILLLLAVFPANIHMFTEAQAEQGWSLYTVGLLLRLPLQFVMMAVVYWCAVQPPVTADAG
jgi:uncharacterized membrane protein